MNRRWNVYAALLYVGRFLALWACLALINFLELPFWPSACVFGLGVLYGALCESE